MITACTDCGTSSAPRLIHPGRRLRKHETPSVLVCPNCYADRRRRRLGVPVKVTLTDVERRAKAAAWAMRRHVANRHAALAAYGGQCSCCGEHEPAFLAIDHIAGGGNAHRRSLSSDGRMVGSSNFYAWLRRNDYPPGFTLLCHNCNFAKSHSPGGCPHQIGARP